MAKELSDQALAISNIFQHVEKTLRAYRTYKQDHPVLLEFEQKLFDQFIDYFKNESSFSIEVRPYQFLYGEEIVYENTDKRENFSFQFNQDGVRQFTFSDGLTIEEVKQFLLIMRVNFQSNEYADDDTITLLWKSGFKHINYVVVETFIHQGEETVDTEKAIMKAAHPFMQDTAPPEIKIAVTQSDDLGNRNLRPSDIEEIKSLPNIKIDYQYNLSHQAGKFQEEITRDEDLIVKRILLLLLRMLLGIGDDNDFLSTANVVQRVIESMVRTKQYDLVSRVLIKLKDLSDPVKNPDPRKASLIGNLIKGLAGPNLLEMIKNDIKTLDSEQIEGLGQLCTTFPAKSVDNLFEIFVSEANPNLRKALFPVLEKHGSEKLELYSSSMSAADTDLALALIDLFVSIGTEQAGLHIKKGFRHIDDKVRTKVLEIAIESFPNHAKSLSLLGITDLNHAIRMKSLNFLVSLKDKKLAGNIFNVIKEDSFDSKNRDEKIHFYIALARIGGKKLYDYLNGEIDKGMLDRSAKEIDRQIAAAWALKQLKIPQAKEAVEKLSKKSLTPKPVKEACQQILKSWAD